MICSRSSSSVDPLVGVLRYELVRAEGARKDNETRLLTRPESEQDDITLAAHVHYVCAAMTDHGLRLLGISCSK